MAELQLLRADHAAAVLAFERENREYFARTISDRGDAFFEHFREQLDARLAEQAAGEAAFYVLVEDGTVVGRFNLILEGDQAVLGYRVAQASTGRGVATTAVRDLCLLAAAEHGVRQVVADTSDGNLASQRVLEKAGFTRVGPAHPADVGGKQGYRYRRSSTQL